MTTTHKGPNMPPSKFHVSLWRPSILQKRLWLIWVISLHQSVCQVPKNSKRMHQEWPCVAGVAQGRGLRPYVGGAQCLVCQLHCARLGKVFWGLCGYIESVCSEGICRSWKNEFHSEIAELKPWRHFSCIDLYTHLAFFTVKLHLLLNTNTRPMIACAELVQRPAVHSLILLHVWDLLRAYVQYFLQPMRLGRPFFLDCESIQP